MIIIRGRILIEERSLQGLIVVVDDESSSNRLLQLLSQLEISINNHYFPEKWKKTKNAKDVQNSLIQDIGSFSVWIKNSGRTAKMRGNKIKEVRLPEHSIIGAMYRDGKITVPDQDEVLKEGDELIVIAQGEAIKELSDRFSEKF